MGEALISRNDVYDAIDSERAYQDTRWNDSTTTSGGRHSLEEWVLYMENYLTEAKHQLSRNAKQVAEPLALATMRKITAMGVAAMEQHGAPRREGF